MQPSKHRKHRCCCEHEPDYSRNNAWLSLFCSPLKHPSHFSASASRLARCLLRAAWIRVDELIRCQLSFWIQCINIDSPPILRCHVRCLRYPPNCLWPKSKLIAFERIPFFLNPTFNFLRLSGVHSFDFVGILYVNYWLQTSILSTPSSIFIIRKS